MLKNLTEKLSECIGAENLENLANMVERVKARAIERHTNQSVEMVFNEHGHVRHINGSDNVNGVKPKSYSAE